MRRLLFVLALLLPADALALCQWQANGANCAGTGTVSCNWPSHTTDDLGLLILETANEAIAGVSAGWAQLTDSPQGTGAAAGVDSTRLTVYWKRAASGGESAATANDPGNHYRGVIVTFRGCDTSGAPFDVTAGDVEATATATAVSVPGDTTTVDDTLVVVIATTDQDVSSTTMFAAPTNASLGSLTEQLDQCGIDGNGGCIWVVTGTKAAAGTYNATTSTLTSAGTQGRISVAIKAASAPTCIPDGMLLGVSRCGDD